MNFMVLKCPQKVILKNLLNLYVLCMESSLFTNFYSKMYFCREIYVTVLLTSDQLVACLLYIQSISPSTAYTIITHAHSL